MKKWNQLTSEEQKQAKQLMALAAMMLAVAGALITYRLVFK